MQGDPSTFIKLDKRLTSAIDKMLDHEIKDLMEKAKVARPSAIEWYQQGQQQQKQQQQQQQQYIAYPQQPPPPQQRIDYYQH